MQELEVRSSGLRVQDSVVRRATENAFPVRGLKGGELHHREWSADPADRLRHMAAPRRPLRRGRQRSAPARVPAHRHRTGLPERGCRRRGPARVRRQARGRFHNDQGHPRNAFERPSARVGRTKPQAPPGRSGRPSPHPLAEPGDRHSGKHGCAQRRKAARPDPADRRIEFYGGAARRGGNGLARENRHQPDRATPLRSARPGRRGDAAARAGDHGVLPGGARQGGRGPGPPQDRRGTRQNRCSGGAALADPAGRYHRDSKGFQRGAASGKSRRARFLAFRRGSG